MHVCPECGWRSDAAGTCSADGRAFEVATDPLLGSEIDRYRLARVLGEGGMGRVYLGVQPSIGSRVAIKVLSEECARSAELLERFFAEARAVNLIRHEHIVGVLDLSRLPDGRPYIVMEFVDGRTLAQLVRGQHAPLGGVARVIGEALSALAAAHAIGIVHRDLKPDNVLVTAEGHAKVLDFGVAKLAPGLDANSPRTRTGALLGTPAYMAPEQISGGRVDARADIYAAGVVLFEAITGRVPFAGATLYDLMRAHVEQAPPSPRALRPELPDAIEHVVLVALAKSPDERFQSATAMAQALAHATAAFPPEQWRSLSTRTEVAARERALASTVAATQPPTRRTRNTAIAVIGAIAACAIGVGGALIAGRGTGTGTGAGAGTATAATATATVTATATPAATVAGPAPVAITASPQPRTHTPRVTPPTAHLDASIDAGTGVIIGPNVHIGSNVIIGSNPPAPTTSFTRPIDYAPKRFDALAYAPKARALARTIYPDAELARFDVYSVFPDGHADLALGDGRSSYVFRSPSHSARPADVPANLPLSIKCYVEVTVTATAVEVRARDMDPIDPSCKWPLRRIPRCKLAHVWKMAAEAGAATTTIAKIAFLSDGQWFFDNEYDGSGIVTSFADNCP